MKSPMHQTAISVVLAISLFCGLSVSCLFAQTNKGLEVVQQQIEGSQVNSQDSQTIVLPKVEYRAGVMRDPFVWQIKQDLAPSTIQDQRQVEEKVPPPALTVSGIIWGGKFPQAIVNNKVVKVGDTLEKAQIISIGKDGVQVLFNNKIFNLLSPAVTQLQSLNPEGGKNEK